MIEGERGKDYVIRRDTRQGRVRKGMLQVAEVMREDEWG